MTCGIYVIGKNRKYVLKIYFTYLSFSVFRYVTFCYNYTSNSPWNWVIQALNIKWSNPTHIFFTSLTIICLFKMSHFEFCSLIVIVLHTFSIMFKSGDWDGQFRQFISFSLFHWTALREAWHGALSSWNMYPSFGNILAITGHTLSPRVSKYFVVFIFPSISVNVPTPSKVMHPQNITATRGPPLKPTH